MILTSDILILSLTTAIVIYISQQMMKMYWSRRRLPPGPFPLPFIGNLLLFRQQKFIHEIMDELSIKYGPVFTVFLGPMPTVVVADPAIGMQALKKHEFAGRPYFPANQLMFGKDSVDIILADYGKEWEALRKVGHNAVRKYINSPVLSKIVVATVDRVIAGVKEESFNSDQQFGNVVTAVIAEAAFGTKYDFDDEDFLRWKEVVEVNNSGGIIVMIPVLRHLFRQQWNHFVKVTDHKKSCIRRMYNTILSNHTEGKDDTFSDAMINAKLEAGIHENRMNQYLKSENICNAIGDLFIAGVDGTRNSLGWMFIMMCRYPEMQDKMRHEVESVIGDREEPNTSHHEKCHYISAFISETLRCRPTSVFGIPHKAIVDAELNGHSIAKHTMVIVSLYHMLHDENEWKDAESFKPERFLNADGTYNPKPNPYFIPFSAGIRSCIGDKLALYNLFLIVTRFLQKTTNIQVIGGVGEHHIKGDLNLLAAWTPIAYEIKLQLKT